MKYQIRDIITLNRRVESNGIIFEAGVICEIESVLKAMNSYVVRFDNGAKLTIPGAYFI